MFESIGRSNFWSTGGRGEAMKVILNGKDCTERFCSSHQVEPVRFARVVWRMRVERGEECWRQEIFHWELFNPLWRALAWRGLRAHHSHTCDGKAEDCTTQQSMSHLAKEFSSDFPAISLQHLFKCKVLQIIVFFKKFSSQMLFFKWRITQYTVNEQWVHSTTKKRFSKNYSNGLKSFHLIILTYICSTNVNLCSVVHVVWAIHILYRHWCILLKSFCL